MTILEKLTIQGIRSYSPDQPNGITFEMPLTIILGTNGSGKTSIIECLKFITTGDLPPGTKLASFIHDPKLCGTVEVRAQVKLQFIDRYGNHCVCTRSLVSVQKENTISSKSLEGTLLYTSIDGKSHSISSRCIDLTNEMVKRMGISKAILDNVVFCHQENSLWPLSEPKILKEKFDAIFSATKYIKALENIRNCRKNHMVKSKESKAELKHLEQRKNKVDELNKSVLFLKTKMEMASGELNAHSSIYNKYKEAYDQTKGDLKAANELLDEKGLLQSQIDHQKDKMTLINANISTVFDFGEDELIQKLAQVASDCEKEQRLDQLSNSIDQFNRQLLCLEKELEDATVLKGVLMHKMKQQVLEKEMWKQSVLQAFQKYGIDFPFDEINLENNLDEIASYLNTIECEEDMRTNKSKEEVEIVSKKLENSSSLCGEKRMLLREMENKKTLNSMNCKKFSENIFQIENKLKSMSDISIMDEQIQKLQTSMRMNMETVSHLEGTIANHNEQYFNLKTQCEKLINEISQFENIKTLAEKKRTIMERLELLEKDNFEKGTQLKQFFEDLSDACISDFLQLPNDDMNKYAEVLSIDKYNDFVLQLKRILSCSMKKLFITKTKMDDAKSEIEESNLKLVSYKEQVLKNNSLLSKWGRAEDSVLKARQQIAFELDQVKQNIAKIEALRGVFEKFIENSCVGSCTNACPLCDRKFDEDDTKQTSLSDKLENKVNSFSSEALTLSSKIKDLEDLLTVFNNASDVSTEDVISLESQIDQMELDVISNELQFEEDFNSNEHMQCMYDQALSFKEAVILLKKNSEKRKEILLELEVINKNESSVQITCDEYNSKQEMKSSLKAEMNKLIKQIDTSTNDLISTKKEGMNSDEALLRIRNQKNEFLKFSDENNSLHQQKAETMKELEFLEKDILLIHSNICSLNDDISSFKTDKIVLEQNLNDLSSVFSKKKAERMILLHDLRSKLESLGRSGSSHEESFEKSMLSIEYLENETKIVKDKKVNVEREFNVTNDSLTDIHKSRRNLELNLELLHLKGSLDNLEIKTDEICEKLGKFDVNSLKEKIETQGYSCEQSLKKVNQVQGTINEICSQIRHVESELSSDFYAKAILEYDDMALSIKLHDLVCSDLDKFYQALDSAIMKFHSIKMEEINSIIKDYWFQTYQGDDIDTIKIISECSEVSNKTLADKRTFNYHVVMVKDDLNLDMRGRCSAGQKMIASIIIRLALAETFCDNCRIMTLDEPTTNIDKDNVTHLAEAILKLLKLNNEKKQQMMIITHDEGLVETLCRADFNENYCRVYKDISGFSKMHNRSVQDLL